MEDSKVSIIIPTYNGANFLGEAIQSVLNQTYPHFELIVVNDASPDHTDEVVKKFNDPRLKYIVHPENRGSDPARITGLNASTGEIIALLDQDDLFHPEKLETHVAFLEENPAVGVTYNARFDLQDSSKAVCGIWDPPDNVTLADVVLGFPFAPSDTVLRRKWALREEIWDNSFVTHGEEVILNGGEIVFFSRLYFAGCNFGNVGRALNYRRYHSGRTLSDLQARCTSERACQEIVLNDPHCPAEVVALRNLAFMNTYRIFAYFAFAQNENSLGQAYVREAVRLDPSQIEGNPCRLVCFMVDHAIAVEKLNQEALLQNFFDYLPSEITWLSEQFDRAMARGYLRRGVRAVMWGEPEGGGVYFKRAAELGAEIDEDFLRNTVSHLLAYSREFGAGAAETVMRNLAPFLDQMGSSNDRRKLRGCYSFNRAINSYQTGKHQEILQQIFQAITNDPKYITNRGLLSILFRSAMGR